MGKMKLLLTGASGMVGRNILEHPAIVDFEMLTPGSNALNLLDSNAVQKYLNKHMQLSQGKNIFTVEIKVI